MNNSKMENVNKKRRQINKIGISAPIIMTLASRPAFGAMCLSNMLSGNLSDPTRGNECNGGGSPGYWKVPNPGQTDLGDTTLAAWDIALGPNAFGVYNGSGNTNNSDNYTGGIELSDTILSGFISFSGVDQRLSYILNNAPGSLLFHLIAGLLNSYYYENKSQHYIVTPSQYLSVLNGSYVIPQSAFDIYGGDDSPSGRIDFLVNLFQVNYDFGPGSTP